MGACKRNRLILVFLAASILWAAPVAALSFEGAPARRIPENSDVRRYLRPQVLAPTDEVLSGEREQVFRHGVSDTRVKYEVRTQNGSFYLLFLNEIPHVRTGDGFPVYGAGSYVIKRSLSDGSFVQAKIFLQTDPGFFVRLFPSGARTRMDVFVAGDLVYDDIVIAASFEQLLFSPISRLMDMTEAIVDWSLVVPDVETERYSAVRTMVERAREGISSLPDAEDGAMNEDGELVFIESLVLQEGQPGFNCSGFAKWISDGIARPRSGEYLSIERLKEKHLDYRGHRWSARREDERDPYFGLDWSRNLAIALLELEHPRREFGPEDADVREVRYARYVEDVGYPVDDMRRILYMLAIDEPGHFYIGSVNQEFGSDPVLRQHVHVAVFFPYFDENGRFRVTVLERNVETDLDSLAERYPGSYVHLVRAQADDRFTPPVIE
ncbi:MAG: hypothetical protein R6W94_15115 [Spirochaetia bacterium]